MANCGHNGYNFPNILIKDEGVNQGAVGVLNFAGAGVSASVSAGVATISIGGGGGGGSLNVSAGTTSNDLTNLVFSNSNGISFGLNGSTITGSHNALTSQSNQAASGSNGSFTFQTLSFSNANGLSFGTSAGPAITASYTVPTVTNSSWTVSDNVTSGTVARLAFTNLNGVTLSLSSGAGGSHTIVGSHNALTSQSNQALSAPNGSFTFQTAQFHNSNGISWSTATGSGIIASHNGLTTQTNQQMTLFATSNTTQSSSGTTNASSLIFAGAGIASVGITNGSVVVSVPAGGGGGDGGVFAGVSTGGATAGSTGTVSTGNFVLVGSNNLTLSQSTAAAGSHATVTILGEAPESRWWNYPAVTQHGTVVGNSLVSVVPLFIPHYMVASQAKLGASVNIATTTNNSSAFIDITASMVFYSRNAATLSSMFSASNSFTNTWSSNATGSVTGPQQLVVTFPSTTLSAGEYFMAVHISTTNSATGGAATTALGNSVSMLGGPLGGSAAQAMRVWAAGTNNTQAAILGQGIISTGATRASIAFSDYTVTGTRGVLAGVFVELANQSVY